MDWLAELIKQGGLAAVSGVELFIIWKLFTENVSLTKQVIDLSRADATSDQQVKSALDRLTEFIKGLVETNAAMARAFENFKDHKDRNRR